MEKLNLSSILTYGKYKDKLLKTVIDEHWYMFSSWYDKTPFMFDEEVQQYVKSIKQAIYNNNRK